MADKMTCPGCDSYTSSVLTAYRDGEPCPYCDLSASAAEEVLAAQRRGADAELTRKYEDAVKHVDALEREVADLRHVVRQVRSAVAE